MRPAPGPEFILLWEAAGGQTGAGPGGSRPAARSAGRYSSLDCRTVSGRGIFNSGKRTPVVESEDEQEMKGKSVFKVRGWYPPCCLVAQVVSDLFATPWIAAHQAPLSVGSPRQEYWSGLPFPSLGHFLIQGSNPCLLHWQADSLPLSQQGSPVSRRLEVIMEDSQRRYLLEGWGR